MNLVARSAAARVGAPRPDALRVMTLNCAHGAGAPIPAALLGRARLQRNLAGIGASLDEVRPDVVALQEIDRGAFWSRGLDEVGLVAAGARMPGVAFGAHKDAPCLGLCQGTAVLSRAPFAAWASRPFRGSCLDDKGWVKVTIMPEALGGRAVEVISVHLHPLSARARRDQIAAMAADLAGSSVSRVVMGDLNAPWGQDGEGGAAHLASALGLHAYQPTAPLDTYPVSRPWRRLDWILLSPDLEFASYEVVAARVSDHCGVVADVLAVE